MLTKKRSSDTFNLKNIDETSTIFKLERGKKMNIFQMKAKPHGHEKLDEFLSMGYVCIGWPGIGNLTQVGKDELRNRLKNKYHYDGHTLGYNLGQVYAFVNTMQANDVVLLKGHNKVHIGVVSNYQYDKMYDNDIDGLCHRRSVEWKNSVALTDLSRELQKFVNNRHTITQYPTTFDPDRFEELFEKKTPLPNVGQERLDSLLNEALDILEEELRSDVPERRLKAASELIRLRTKGGE